MITEQNFSLAEVKKAKDLVLAELSKKIVGQHDVIEQSLIALLAQGHCIFVGVPGLAKTLLIKSLSQSLGLAFNRIQFTPDLMPSDITGTEILQENPDTKQRSFSFLKGPVFTNLLLADELNRTPPKTQSALLQAMQERAVTVAGKTMNLDPPFLVFATQNPVEQEGTYQLPEAQLDRFMLMINVDYPSLEEEIQIIRQTTQKEQGEIQSVLSKAEIMLLQAKVKEIPVAEELLSYATKLVRATRPQDPLCPKGVKEYIQWGAGPRAGQALILAGKAKALLNGKAHVSKEDLISIAPSVLIHRVLCNYRAQAENLNSQQLLNRLLDTIQ
jgi:MoxR-like ATPase